MLITDIRILNEITDIENDSIDVCVDVEDGYTFIVSISVSAAELCATSEKD